MSPSRFDSAAEDGDGISGGREASDAGGDGGGSCWGDEEVDPGTINSVAIDTPRVGDNDSGLEAMSDVGGLGDDGPVGSGRDDSGDGMSDVDEQGDTGDASRDEMYAALSLDQFLDGELCEEGSLNPDEQTGVENNPETRRRRVRVGWKEFVREGLGMSYTEWPFLMGDSK